MSGTNEKTSAFLKEKLRVGALRGFKYFSLYLRGREELEVTIPHPRKTTSMNRSYSVRSLRGNLQPMAYGLPPASPTEGEMQTGRAGDEDAVFLVAAYAKYKCAYVWLRSNHHRILAPGTLSDPDNKDSPLTLTSTERWNEVSRVYVWEILAELIGLSVKPPPGNPFAIDYHQLDQVPPFERAFAAAGLLHFLRRVWLARPPYQDLVLQDIRELCNRHFTDLPRVICDGRTGEKRDELSVLGAMGAR